MLPSHFSVTKAHHAQEPAHKKGVTRACMSIKAVVLLRSKPPAWHYISRSLVPEHGTTSPMTAADAVVPLSASHLRHHRHHLGSTGRPELLLGGQLVATLHGVRADRHAREGGEESGHDCQAERPREPVDVEAWHPRAVFADHHAERGDGDGDERHCNGRSEGYLCDPSDIWKNVY